MKTRLLSSCRIWLVSFWFLTIATAAHAAPPKLDLLYPAGVQRGTTIEVTASGTFDNWPVQGWADRAGIKFEPKEEKGKFAVSVHEDVPPGVVRVRLYNDDGASAVRNFIVGTLAEIVEAESNNEPAKPQAVEGSRVVINGKFQAQGDVDVFAVALKQGETLVAALDANRVLASPLDGVLQILSHDGFVLAQNDDTHGLDPRLVFTATADGKYLVRAFAFPATPDSTIALAGGASYVYRLTLTTGGFLDHAWPLTVSRSSPTEIELHGWNIAPDAKHMTIPPDDLSSEITLFHPQLANTLTVPRVAHSTIVELEPSDAKQPQSLSLPVTLTGRLDPARDEDVFSIPAKKGDNLVFRIESETLGYPVDPVLTLNGPDGNLISRVDDPQGGRRSSGAGRDAEIAFTAKADGEHRLIVADLHRRGGFRCVYRLTASVAQPDYALTLAADAFTLTPGKPLEISVTIDRRQNFEGEIEIAALGLPEGVMCPPVKSPAKGDEAKTVKLVLTATDGPRSGPIRITGTVGEQPTLARTAQATVAALNNARLSDVWLTVAKPPEAK